MRKSSRIAVSFIVVLLLASLAAGCKFDFAGTELKAAKLNSDFVDGVIAAHKDGFCDNACEADLLGSDRLVMQYMDQAADAYLNVSTKSGTAAKLDAAIAAIDDANQRRLLGVKDEGRRTALSAILISIRGLLTTAKAAIAGGAK